MEGTNLETDGGAASKNIGEMLAANYSPDVAIVLATGAANKGSSGWVSSWKTVKYHIVRNASLEEKADLGNVDMGKPEQLTNFIEWGQKYYAADRYILVFWDHGGGTLGGFGGYGGDPNKTYPADYPTASGLTVAQLRDVVKANVAKTGKKFELIGFDACLMGTLEIANSFTGSANYLVASQDIEAGAGWDWTAMVNFVVGNPNADGGKIGTAIAKSFYAKLERAGEGENKTATMSVINLEKIKPLNEALAAFSVWQQKLLTDDGIDAWYNLAYSRSKTMDFYTSDLDLSGSGDTVDILDLIDNIQTMSQDNITADDGLMFEQFEKAVRNAVLYNQVGTERTSVSGLSMMFPTYTVWSNGDGGASFNNLAVYTDIAPDSLYSALIADYSKRARTIAQITIGNPVDDDSVITATVNGAGPFGYEMAYIAMTNTTKDD
ncbi:MAG TPA: clostripain-related cysteine peptidase, partial [Leptolinea sp.]